MTLANEGPPLRWVHSEPASGAANMAADEALLETVRDGGGPILRTYTWNPPTLSLGYGQDLADVDTDRCRELGIELVRRPTGGRAVLHWEELTYCYLCLPPDGDDSIRASYQTVGRCLQRGLQLYGVDVELSRGRVGSGHRAACFASTSRSEITSRGRKLIGSAQRRIRGALLQHGSLLIGGAHRMLAEVVEGESVESIAASAIHLQEIQAEIDPEVLAACLADGFADVLDRPLKAEGLSPGEQIRADELTCEKYGTLTHLHRRETASAVEDDRGTAAVVEDDHGTAAVVEDDHGTAAVVEA
ncbi:MAG: lipoate--protein ligase family protein [Gemmatimonadetes bacterium]|nr:lipoate--protein ligase family protein [Gemmatimonadota bacterium]